MYIAYNKILSTVAMFTRLARRNYLFDKFFERPIFLTLCNSFTKRSTIMSTGSNFGVLMEKSLLSVEEFAFIFRAIHYVAMKKKKPIESPSSPTKIEMITGGDRSAIVDITNVIEKPLAPLIKVANFQPEKDDSTKISDQKKDDLEKQKTPFQRFRGRYLIVSDFTSQLWCEQQMDYNFDPPPGVEIKPKPQMATGTDLHLARELEVQEIVEVNITSREDAFALKLLNLIACVQDFLSGEHTIRREVPIFGTPFNLDLFIVGVIDEVRFDRQLRKVDIIELKTRLASRLPSKAQKKTHNLQVMLYRRMWIELISGQLTKADIIRHMKLVPDAILGNDMCNQIQALGILRNSASITLDSLLDRFFIEIINFADAGDLFVEYCHQETKERFAIESVDYNEIWLRKQLENSSSYWRGERSPRGVEIEEAWKCKFCDFSDVCSWRIKKQEECTSKNRQNFIDNTVMLPSFKT